jgi:hypothetical protein
MHSSAMHGSHHRDFADDALIVKSISTDHCGYGHFGFALSISTMAILLMVAVALILRLMKKLAAAERAGWRTNS